MFMRARVLGNLNCNFISAHFLSEEKQKKKPVHPGGDVLAGISIWVPLCYGVAMSQCPGHYFSRYGLDCPADYFSGRILGCQHGVVSN